MTETPAADVLIRQGRALLREAALVDGDWIVARADAVAVEDPAEETLLGHVPRLSAAEVDRAIAAAAQAFPDWSRRKGKARGEILRRWSELVARNEQGLAALISLENGKPYPEALGEVRYANSFIVWFAGMAERLDGKTIESANGEDLILAFREPVGPVAAITPWNFPAAMITRKAAAAFCAGCTMVLKPASATPFTGIALAALALEAGLPEGCFSVVTGAQDVAVEGTVAGKFRAGGQTCVCPNRVYVQAGLKDAFLARLTERVAALKVGKPFEPGVQIGPLIDPKGVAKVEDHLSRTVASGGEVLAGGARHARGGRFFQPTVVAGGADELFCNEETFGPVVPVFAFDTEEEVLARANASEYGLAAFLFTDDLNRALRVGRALEAGIVGVNSGLISNAANPFGGVKQSGYGREGSAYGVDDYLQIKSLTLALR